MPETQLRTTLTLIAMMGLAMFVLGAVLAAFANRLTAYGYLLMPIDIVPDFLPVLGQLDDILVLLMLVGIGMMLVPREIKVDVRRRTESPREHEPIAAKAA